MSKSHRPHPQTRARDAIQILEELKRLLIIAESDPLCREAKDLYDNVERTLREALSISARVCKAASSC